MQKEFITLDLSSIIPYENNPRINEDAVPDVEESMRQCGNIDPIEVDENNVILSGHTRLMALQQLGETETEVLRVTGLSEEQKKKYRILANKTGEKALWDFEKLSEELEGLDFDGFDFGFDSELLDGGAFQGEISDDNYDGEVPEEPKAKVGDLYRLGNHRLICGDSTNEDTVKKLFSGEQPFCIVTDPPYCSGGFQESGKSSGSIGTRDNIMIANDTLSTRGYMALIKRVLSVAGKVGIVYAFTDWRMWVNLFDCMESSGFGVRNMIVWDKGTPGMGVGWRSQHEICMMASRSAQKFNPHKAQGNVIECARTGNVNHPTEKPVELIEKIIDVTDFAESIYDPFGGSGTTLIACEQLNRKCYMCELDPRYIDVIIDRWEKFTGKKAELIK